MNGGLFLRGIHFSLRHRQAVGVAVTQNKTVMLLSVRATLMHSSWAIFSLAASFSEGLTGHTEYSLLTVSAGTWARLNSDHCSVTAVMTRDVPCVLGSWTYANIPLVA